MASEKEEFTMLFTDFYPRLCRFLECLLGGRAPLAQDLAQESFLQLHRTAWGTMPAGQGGVWRNRVSRTQAINMMAGKDAAPEHTQLDFLEPIDTPAELNDYLGRVRVSAIATSGLNRRDELGAVTPVMASAAGLKEMSTPF